MNYASITYLISIYLFLHFLINLLIYCFQKHLTANTCGKGTASLSHRRLRASIIQNNLQRDSCHFWHVYDYRTDKTEKQRHLPFLAGLRLPYRQTDRQRQPPFLAYLLLSYRHNRQVDRDLCIFCYLQDSDKAISKSKLLLSFFFFLPLLFFRPDITLCD